MTVCCVSSSVLRASHGLIHLIPTRLLAPAALILQMRHRVVGGWPQGHMANRWGHRDLKPGHLTQRPGSLGSTSHWIYPWSVQRPACLQRREEAAKMKGEGE